MLLQVIVSFIASLGFGIIFNIKGKNLIFAALGGGLSWFCSLFFSKQGMSDALSFFCSSIIFSIYSEICARKLKTPITTILICALIPLVPGAGMYYTMYETITGNVQKAIHLGLNTCASAGSLALGVIFVSTITKHITQFKKLFLKNDNK
ncbi:threonine/serine exporter family protein [Clostridium sp. SM-530-WT-3G]|uniref:threonine/serine exporter family protein n=1 Tax=Clostridium sp. SM-530-WT-3G TaxID=2725303 RepID=UPI00145DC763|nr:threonine/serine exporter family protein [Clostridium sp. SM-530-WT-3G]NME84375.1 threonine/serine exporter [Clostridium sp. SM-530-WT-3G]